MQLTKSNLSLFLSLFSLTIAKQEHVDCILNKNCLQYVKTDTCREIIKNCIVTHAEEIEKSVECCEEQNCGRANAKPDSLIDQFKELYCLVPCFFEGTKKNSDGQTMNSDRGYVMGLGQQLSDYLKVDFLEDFRFGGFGSEEKVVDDKVSQEAGTEDVELVDQNEIEEENEATRA